MCIMVGDCAKPAAGAIPGREVLGQHARSIPNCTPIWANCPDVRHRELRASAAAVREAVSSLSGLRRLHCRIERAGKGRTRWQPESLLRQGILKLLAIKDSDVRILTLEQCRDAVDKGLHAGGAFSATIPLVALLLRRLHRYRCGRPNARRAGHLRAQQGPRGCGAGIHLRRTRLLRRQRPEELALVREHSQRPSGAGSARDSDRNRANGPGVSAWRRDSRSPGAPPPKFDSYAVTGDGELAGRADLGSRDVRRARSIWTISASWWTRTTANSISRAAWSFRCRSSRPYSSRSDGGVSASTPPSTTAFTLRWKLPQRAAQR